MPNIKKYYTITFRKFKEKKIKFLLIIATHVNICFNSVFDGLYKLQIVRNLGLVIYPHRPSHTYLPTRCRAESSVGERTYAKFTWRSLETICR